MKRTSYRKWTGIPRRRGRRFSFAKVWDQVMADPRLPTKEQRAFARAVLAILRSLPPVDYVVMAREMARNAGIPARHVRTEADLAFHKARQEIIRKRRRRAAALKGWRTRTLKAKIRRMKSR